MERGICPKCLAKIDYSRGSVVTHWPSTSEGGGSNPRPSVGNLVVNDLFRQFTVQNLDQLYVLVSFAYKTTRRDMTCTVLKALTLVDNFTSLLI